MDSFESLDMSDDELAAWEAERRDRIASEKANFAAHSDALKAMWE